MMFQPLPGFVSGASGHEAPPRLLNDVMFGKEGSRVRSMLSR